MVIRKPVPTTSTSIIRQNDALPTRPVSNTTEYPIGNPYAEDIPPWDVGGQERHLQKASANGGLQQQPNYTSTSDNSNAWVEEDSRQREVGDPRQFWPNSENTMQNHGHEGLPSTVRIGSTLETPRTSSESQGLPEPKVPSQPEVPQAAAAYPLQSTNPYHRTRSSVHSKAEVLHSTEDSSVDVWAELSSLPPQPKAAPPPPPVASSPSPQQKDETRNDFFVDEIRGLSISDHIAPNTSISSGYVERDPPLIALEQNNESLRMASKRRQIHAMETPSEVNAQSEYHPDSWNQNHQFDAPQELSDHTIWESGLSPARQKSTEKHLPAIPLDAYDETPPQLPPRRSQDREGTPPPQPSQNPPTQIPAIGPARSDTEIPGTTARNHRSETYPIKHITWVDSITALPRTSPIMVQNANGPCPLLALVNALTLSTPANTNTALIETLRVREQVSLGLLLDAVFDELMSGRRGDAAQELPDVGELYAFLVTLHTGMNVNPCFVPSSSQTPNVVDASKTIPPTTTHDFRRPGGFEETTEMKLYSTFSIPLIHGWLPPQNHPAFVALTRSARTYEDAQNLMFREEELEDKLQQHGLNPDEQLQLEDIASIKYFLSSSATQLTGYGLDTITEALLPGSIAILFRNDHFSTLYKHPRSGQLLTLVTDMGYAGHDEVVWESLVDVRGEGSEFFSGDFRPVGNSPGVQQENDGWRTVSRPGRKNKNQQQRLLTATNYQGGSTLSNPQRLPTPPLDSDFDPPMSPNTEQEDHDLALAMQLQEEEEDRSRRDAEARQREDELSRAYLDSQVESTNRRTNLTRGQTVRPLVPPRNSNNATSRGGTTAATLGGSRVPPRGGVSRPDPEAGEDAPPPSYEQAAKSLPYNPSVDQQPSYPNFSPILGNSASGIRPRQMSAYSQHASNIGSSASAYGRRDSAVRNSVPIRAPDEVPGILRRRSAGVNGNPLEGEDEGRNKDCIIM